MTKMLQRHRRFGKLRDPEELVVRCQLRYLPDVLAELRHQPGRGFIGASGLPEHVAKNNTRFSPHSLLEVGGPVLLGRHVLAALWFFIIGWSGLRTSAYVLKVAIRHHLDYFPGVE